MNFLQLLKQFLPQIIDFISKWMAKPAPAPDAAALQKAKEDLHAKITSFKLKRTQITVNGIFSELFDDKDQHVCFTAEHAYGGLSKVPDGKYVVKLGTHQLDHGDPLLLYEITGVEGHQGICFHIGNAPQHDSDGCLLMGQTITTLNGVEIVTNSRFTFEEFMKRMAGVTEFMLEVS